MSWFYQWVKDPTGPQRARQAVMDAEVAHRFGGSDRTYGSPRIHFDLVGAGWQVSVSTVADSMHRQGLSVGDRSIPRG